jgi:hypothetical protein
MLGVNPQQRRWDPTSIVEHNVLPERRSPHLLPRLLTHVDVLFSAALEGAFFFFFFTDDPPLTARVRRANIPGEGGVT